MVKKTDAKKTDEVTQKLLQKITDLTNDLQRTRADFENFRKQTESQREHYGNTVKESTVNKFLPLIDDMSRAIMANTETLSPLQKTLDKTLSELQLKPVDSVVGSVFNPDLHEAVMVEGEGDKEFISETLRPGYYYEGRLIRPAMVKVKKQ